VAWSEPPALGLATTELSAFLDLAAPIETTSRAETPQAVAVVARLAAAVMGFEDLDRKRPRGKAERQKVLLATCAIVGGVLRAWGRGKAGPVAFSWRNEALGDIPGGRTAAKAVVDVLMKVRLLAFTPGVQWAKDHGFGIERGGKVSRIWPTAELLKIVADAGIEPEAVNAAFPAPQPGEPPTRSAEISAASVRVNGASGPVSMSRPRWRRSKAWAVSAWPVSLARLRASAKPRSISPTRMFRRRRASVRSWV
jgi:hypothetical protein